MQYSKTNTNVNHGLFFYPAEIYLFSGHRAVPAQVRFRLRGKHNIDNIMSWNRNNTGNRVFTGTPFDNSIRHN